MERKRLKLLVCALAIGLCVSLANADIETGLVGYWPLEEGTGFETADATGNGHDGLLTGTPAWESGPEGFGGALLLNVVYESQDGVYCGTDCNPSAGTGQFTLAMWVKWDGLKEDMHFMTKSNNWTGGVGGDTMMWQWEVYKANQNIGLSKCADSGSVANSAVMTDYNFLERMAGNEWIHLAVTYDGTNALLYANGVQDPDGVGPLPFVFGPKTDAQFLLGRNTTNENYRARSFDGSIDDARVYNRVLTEDDIMALTSPDPHFNCAPRVDAGEYQPLLWQAPSVTAQLDGTASDDGKPYQDPPADPCTPIGLTLTWSKTSGPGTVVFSDTTIEDPTATFDAAGMYELRLRGYDGEKDSCDVVTIYIRPNDDPIAHWDFDEGSGATVNDDSANNNEGARTGDAEPNWVSGWVGSGAMEFYGVGGTDISSYVDITSDLLASDPNLENLKYDVTLAAWFKIDDLANSYYPVVVGNSNVGWRIFAETGDRLGQITFTPGDSLSGSRTYSNKLVNDGYWHHIVGVYDYANSKSYLYIDGVLDHSEDNAGLLEFGDDKPVTIGARATSDTEVERGWNGLIDDVRIYSYALSAAQAAALAAMGDVPPAVNAGEDQTYAIQRGPLQLDATVTEDGVPAMSTLKWTADPCTATFSDDAIEDPIVTFPDVGTYVLRLTADDTSATAYGEITITVINPVCQDIIDDGLLAASDISGPDGTPDCYVNLYDFAAIAGDWLSCNDPQNAECELPY